MEKSKMEDKIDVNNNFNSYRQGGYEQVRKDVPINAVKALTGASTVGIGRAYTKGYMKTTFIPSLYQEGTNAAVKKVNKNK